MPKNGQTHSNKSSADCLSVFDHLMNLALKGLTTERSFLFLQFNCSPSYMMESPKYGSVREEVNLKNKQTPHVKDDRPLHQTLNGDRTKIYLIFQNKTF